MLSRLKALKQQRAGNKTMNNKEKFDNLLQLAEFGAKRIEERRSTEFRIFISYSTLLVLVLYQLIKQTSPSISLSLWEGLGLYCLALLMHAIYGIWQVGIGIAMGNDALRRNVYLREAERISGHIPKYHENSDYKKKT